MAHGYYYALGLFLSTLFGAIITTHFNYQVETHTVISCTFLIARQLHSLEPRRRRGKRAPGIHCLRMRLIITQNHVDLCR